MLHHTVCYRMLCYRTLNMARRCLCLCVSCVGMAGAAGGVVCVQGREGMQQAPRRGCGVLLQGRGVTGLHDPMTHVVS